MYKQSCNIYCVLLGKTPSAYCLSIILRKTLDRLKKKERTVNFQSVCKTVAAFALAAMCIFSTDSLAQSGGKPSSSVNFDGIKKREFRVAERNNVYCAGYVQTSPIDTASRLVGAVEEQEQNIYSENDVVYLNFGSNHGAKVGDILSVVRPRGQVKTRWTRKGSLGFYVQEVGAVEIIRVKAEVSIAHVKTSCDNLLLGDLVQPAQERISPAFEKRPALDLYSDPSGKAMGRLFMARDNQEMISREQIVYVDLGAEDNVKIGDYLTVFRPLGKGNLFINDEDETVKARISDFQSFEYRGGRFSNQAARKSGDTAKGKVVTTEKAKEDRPSGLRKVVGEMVILNVKERTATALITRTAQEIHTGDWVEVQ